jgi:mutator protein MutT
MKVYSNLIILNEDNEILFLQRSSNDDFKPKEWCLPGGSVEKLETPIQAAVRECKEETFLDFEEEEVCFVIQKEYPTEEKILFYFLVQVENLDYSKIILNEESNNWKFLNIEQLNEEELLLDLKQHIEELFNEVLISVCKETLTEYNIQFIDNMTQIDYFVNLLNRSNIIPYKIRWQKLILWDE